ncbi:MAG: RHS repeat-associated core domain-containing protein [Candidatus Pseudomonas phytovorans]|uniref:RHS repeat-associated core domain-containing protein n=1 Tax=Candidatus Pseudomonas phytovorans TaxID=3121377 RepID=A0AAJ5WD89_9PSED|nr:RHS repeat-associated core domain-containing protein [Pseudomonas sp.]WEK28645.1 MAG: RHS repeat-associated core domain-containing protein [Pseudomonas sp.]
MKLPAGQPVGFNGERLERQSGMYALGHGYRWYSTTLMRFNSADSVSPFGAGGTNAYAYVRNDPVNLFDPDGHSPAGPTAVQGRMFNFHTGLKKIIPFEGDYGIYKSTSRLFTKPKLFVYTHGRQNALKIDGKALSPNEFNEWLKAKNVKVKHYKEVVFAACLSEYPEPGATSFAQQFSNLNNVKVSALKGLGWAFITQDFNPKKSQLGLLSEPYAGIFPEPLHEGSRGLELFPRAYDFTRVTPQSARRVREDG